MAYADASPLKLQIQGALLVRGHTLGELGVVLGVSHTTLTNLLKDPERWTWGQIKKTMELLGRDQTLAIFFSDGV